MSDTALVPMDKLREMADSMARAGIFGKTPEQIFSLMLIAQAEGIHPAVAVQEYDIIQNRPAINSRSALSRFQAAGGSIQWTERSDKRAAAKFYHPQGGEVEIAWDMTRAAQAGLTGKDNWKKFPAQMLSARVIAEGVRAVYPACLSRMYTVEEVQDMEPRKMRAVADPSAPPVFAEPEDEPVPVHPGDDPDRAALRAILKEYPVKFNEQQRAKIEEAIDDDRYPPEEVERILRRARTFLGIEA